MSDLDRIQSELPIPASGKWDAPTEAALRTFQLSRGLPATGQPDPATLAALGIYDPAGHVSGRQKKHLEGGPYPGRFGRDLVGAMNQIPMWAWLLIGVVSAGSAGVAYYYANRRR